MGKWGHKILKCKDKNICNFTKMPTKLMKEEIISLIAHKKHILGTCISYCTFIQIYYRLHSNSTSPKNVPLLYLSDFFSCIVTDNRI